MTEPKQQVATPERFLSGYTGRLFRVLLLGSISVQIGRYLLPPLLPRIITDLGITAAQAGVALSVMSVFYAILHYPGGRMSDELSRKTVVGVGFALVLIGLAILTASTTYLLLLIGFAGVGAGRGLFAPSGRALISDLFVNRRGQAFGFFMSSTDIAGVIAASLAIAFAVMAWQIAFIPVIILLSVVLIWFHRVARERYFFTSITLDIRNTVKRLFTVPRIRWIVVVYVLFILTVTGIIGFLPTFLRVTHGFSPTAANATFALLFVVGTASKPIAGKLSDVIIRPAIGAGALFIGMLGIGMMVLAESPPLVVGGVIVYAFGYKGFGPVMQAYLMDLFPDESMGGDLGATRTLYLGVGGLGPTYVGIVASKMSYRVAFSGFLLCLLAASIITLLIAYSELLGSFDKNG